ncbi:MAG: hypothetical protein IKQ03_12590 [Prevotella sp.]|nr:hypothetical protein [Prevotella sp.]
MNKINILCSYNQRYSSDMNIQEVVSWILRIAILDNNGDIIDANPHEATYSKPGIHKKEMFMRFFEELYEQINSKNIDKRKACHLFSYYAIKFDQYKNFRLDITDYKSTDELEKLETGDDKMKYSIFWSGFRKFVDEMKKEWEQIKEEEKKSFIDK